MNPELHDLFANAATFLHSQRPHDFSYVNGRWYARIQDPQTGDWFWGQETARHRLLEAVQQLTARIMPDTPHAETMARQLNSTWGQKQVTGRAAALFRANYLPAPAPAPEPPAPEAGN